MLSALNIHGMNCSRTTFFIDQQLNLWLSYIVSGLKLGMKSEDSPSTSPGELSHIFSDDFRLIEPVGTNC